MRFFSARHSTVFWRALYVLFLCVSIMGMCPGSAIASGSTPVNQDIAPQLSPICSNQPVPPGYVVTQVNFSPTNSCYPNSNQYVLATPSDNLQVCAIGNLPAGWVVLSMKDIGSPCGGYQPETITAVTGTQMSVCANSVIPSGWIVIQITAAGGICQQNEIFTMEVLGTSQMSMCSTAPPPVGWLTIGVTSAGNATCLNYERFTITPLGSNSSLGGCWVDGQALPANWIVTSLGNVGGSTCQNYESETAYHVRVTDSLQYMCEGVSTTPVYWSIIATQYNPGVCQQATEATISQTGGPSIPSADHTLLTSYNPNTHSGTPPLDLNGDGLSDLLVFGANASQFEYLITGNNGGSYTLASSRTVSFTPGYWIAAVGSTGLVWTSANNDLYLWTPSVGSTITFGSTFIANYPAGWKLIGAGASGTGSTSDLLWINDGTCQYGWWQMNGAARTVGAINALPSCTTHVVAMGYFSGGSATDLLVETGGPYSELQWWIKNPSYGTLQPDGYVHISLGTLPSGKFAGADTAQGSNTPVVYFVQSNGVVAQYSSQISGSSGSLNLLNLFPIPAGSYFGQIGGTYDGTGNQSIMWANDGAGSLTIWKQNGSGFTSQATNVTYPSGWTLMGGSK